MRSLPLSLFLLLCFAYLPAVFSGRGECVPDSTDLQRYHCFSSTRAFVCEDEEEECAKWAADNECRRNPGFMLEHCRKSCSTCVDGHSGTLQVAPSPASANDVARRLQETVDYLLGHPKAKCRNTDPQCTLRAVQGECETSKWMQTNCAPACQTCHLAS